jgi:hypothetical protein
MKKGTTESRAAPMVGKDFRRRLDCACGGEMRALGHQFYYCLRCGRARWAKEGVGGWLFLVGVLSLLSLAVLGIVGIYGEGFR